MSVNPYVRRVAHKQGACPSFQDAYQRTLPAISSLEGLSPEDPHAELCMQVLRQGLEAMEAQTSQMIDMLYQVDVYMAPSTVQNAAGFNPQEALSHVSELFHAELLAKREALADYTCEDINLSQFVAQWRTLDSVQRGRQQEMDDLADLLAKFG